MVKKNYIPTNYICFIFKNGFEKKKSKKILQKIEHACTKVGFFQIVGHNIRQSDIKKITKVGNLFFNLKSEKKLMLAPKKWNRKNNKFLKFISPYYHILVWGME